MNHRRTATWVALAILGLALLWFRHDLYAAVRLLREQLTLSTALAIAAVTLLHFANEPLRWWIFLNGRAPRATLTRTYHALTVTALASYVFPARLGLPVRLLMAKRVLGLDYPRASALLLVDSALSYGLWSLVALLGVAVLLPSFRLATPLAVALAIAALLLVVLLVARRRWGVSGRHPLGVVLKTGLEFLSLKTGSANIVVFLIDILAYSVRHELILLALGVRASLFDLTLVVAMSVVAGFVSFMPLGLGTYDASLVFLLAMIGVPREAALAVPLINRIATMLIGGTLGALSAAHLGIRSRAELATPGDEAMAAAWSNRGMEIEEP